MDEFVSYKAGSEHCNQITHQVWSGCLSVSTPVSVSDLSVCVQFVLQQVDITVPENSVWFDRYRWDIPVFHLNGQFVMKHRVDVVLLDKLLQDAEAQKTWQHLLSDLQSARPIPFILSEHWKHLGLTPRDASISRYLHRDVWKKRSKNYSTFCLNPLNFKVIEMIRTCDWPVQQDLGGVTHHHVCLHRVLPWWS